LVFPSVTANNASDGDFWQTRAAFPQAVSGIKAVTVNDTIYVFSSHFTYMYDPIADNWVTKQAMPTPRNDYAIATVENKIYIIGGQGPTAPSSVNEVYDTITDTWTTKQPLYPARVQMEANVVDGKIYVIGGVGPARSDGQGFESLNEVYDPATDEWTSKTPPVDFMSSYLSCVIDKKIYIISHEFNVDIYNTETDNWSKGSDIPEFYVGRGIAATTGEYAPKRIYVLGGYESTGFGEATVNNLNYVYDPTADSWSTAANMLTARSSFAVAVVKDKIYVIGGAVGWYDRTNAC
jgi:N-acetylneuraminic acid mutarotase